MAQSGNDPARRDVVRMRGLMLVVLATPLLVFIAVLGTRFGWWSVDVGRDLLALQIGRWVALAGVAAGVLAIVVGLRNIRAFGLMALAAVLVSFGSFGLLVYQQTRLVERAPLDVTTAPSDVPGFASETVAIRTALQAPNAPQVCLGLAPVPRQVAAETVTTALEAAGFTVQRAGLFQSEGLHEGFWFGLRHDAVVRIRPRQTDVRVTARDGRPQGDAACQLAKKIIAGL